MEFINLKQGGMSVRESSLKFTKFSKISPSLVADYRSCMNTFTLVVSNLVETP